MIGTMLGVLFVCLIGTVPIAVSLGLSCVATFALGGGGNMIQMLAQSMVTSMDSFSLMAIPFFMLVGSLMEYGGIAKKLVDVAEMMTGNMPGGLGMAAIVAFYVLCCNLRFRSGNSCSYRRYYDRSYGIPGLLQRL